MDTAQPPYRGSAFTVFLVAVGLLVVVLAVGGVLFGGRGSRGPGESPAAAAGPERRPAQAERTPGAAADGTPGEALPGGVGVGSSDEATWALRPMIHEVRLPGATEVSLQLIDTDNDGLADLREDVNSNGIRDEDETDPRNPDTDGDGWADGLEVKILLSDPLDPNDPGPLEDGDGDGLPSILDPDDDNRDADGDRIADGYEAVALDLAAVSNAARYPPIGDLNADGYVSNVDALIVQGVFLRILPGEQFHMENADANSDQRISNVDALILHSFFMQQTELLPASAN